MSKSQKSFTVRELCYIAVFTVIIILCSQLSIPMPAGVPMTLQTLIIPLAGIILGPRDGTLSTLIYVLLGAVGVPVFAGFTGGPGILFGMTGGFILSFPLLALFAGLGSLNHGKALLFGALVLGTAVNYAVGTVMFMAITGSTFEASLAACVVPFLPTTVIKIILAGILGPALRTTLRKAGVLEGPR